MQKLQVRDVILDIARMKRREAHLVRELESVRNEISRQENFLYDTFQDESIELARQIRKEVPPETPPLTDK